MPDLKGAANVYLVLALVVPGMLIVWARAQFITGRLQPVKDAVVAYLALSVVYYALAFPAVEYALTFERPGCRATRAFQKDRSPRGSSI